jgi:hypothetical protein
VTVLRRLSIAAVAALLAGCSMLLPPAGIQLTLPPVGDLGPHPVTVVDHAGILRAAAPGNPPNGFEPGVAIQAVTGRDEAVLLTWIGGECDDRSIVTIDPAGGGYRVHVDMPSSAMGCSAVGIPRSVLLTLDRAVEAASFVPG